MKRLLIVVVVALGSASLFAATSDQLFAAGKLALAQNDADKAAGLFEQLVKMKPDSSEYHFWLGRSYGSQASKASMFSAPGLTTKTRNEFERAVQLDPNNTDARLSLIEYYMRLPVSWAGAKRTLSSKPWRPGNGMR